MTKPAALSRLQDLAALANLAGPVAPAELRRVVDERVDPPPGIPARWMHGAVLRGAMTDSRGHDDTAAPGAVRRGSLRLRDRSGPLTEGVDYLVDEQWAAVTRLRELVPPVVASYEFSLLRVDTLVMRKNLPAIVRGHSHLSNPVPPRLADGDVPIASMYVPYFSDGTYGTAATSVTLIPIRPSSTGAVSTVQTELLPAFQAARAAERPARITCWGDSVTAGGSSSSRTTAYPQQLSDILRASGMDVEVSTVAVAGSNSRQWLGGETPMAGTEWERLAATRPDVVTLEFVNDAELPADSWPGLYEEILDRTTSLGADLLLLEPHFTRLDWMGMSSLDDPDPRPYVGFLRALARDRNIAIASVSARWARLYSEGIAYPTLLRNGINHPDDRGHRIFAEEAAAVMGASTASTAGAGNATRMPRGYADAH